MAQFLFIARGTEHTRPNDVERLGGQEAAVVWDGVAAGIVRGSFYLEGKRGAVLLLEAADTDLATQFVGRLPMVQQEIVAHELIALEPYVGLERLFGPEATGDQP